MWTRNLGGQTPVGLLTRLCEHTGQGQRDCRKINTSRDTGGGVVETDGTRRRRVRWDSERTGSGVVSGVFGVCPSIGSTLDQDW